MSFHTPITIAEAVDAIAQNQFVLPAIQREFVWKAGQITKLFDSLMRGYPIGSFLFWRIGKERVHDYQYYRFLDRYHQKDHRHNEPITLTGSQDATAVLDGQQRLTAINIGIRGSYAYKMPHAWWRSHNAFPERRLYLDLLAPPDEDGEQAYAFQMLRKEDLARAGQGRHWFLVGDILKMQGLKDVNRYCREHQLVGEGLDHPTDSLVRLWQVFTQDRVVNYFLETSPDLDKVLNIFIRVNSGGTPLSASDMLLSIATAEWATGNARELVHGLVDDLNRTGAGFSFSKDLVMKAALVLADVGAIEFRARNFNRQNMQLVESNWEGIARALKLTARLVAGFGFNRDRLSSHSALVPISYYLHRRGSPEAILTRDAYRDDRDRIRLWLIRSQLKQTFSGQADSLLRRMRAIIAADHAVFPAEAIYADLRRSIRSMVFDDAQIEGLLDRRFGSHDTFIVLALLYPWIKFDHQFHVDHIFPRALFDRRNLERQGIAPERCPEWLDHANDLSNLQLLQGLVNQEKSDKDFEAWLLGHEQEPSGLAHYRDMHIIPTGSLDFAEFPAFLAARRALLRERLRDILQPETQEAEPIPDELAAEFDREGGDLDS